MKRNKSKELVEIEKSVDKDLRGKSIRRARGGFRLKKETFDEETRRMIKESSEPWR